MVQHGVVVESQVKPDAQDIAGGIAADIAAMRAAVHGELSSRNHIVDHLLDLRLAGRDNPVTVTMVDRLLEELPGRTTVANSWWLEALADLERTIYPRPV